MLKLFLGIVVISFIFSCTDITESWIWLDVDPDVEPYSIISCNPCDTFHFNFGYTCDTILSDNDFEVKGYTVVEDTLGRKFKGEEVSEKFTYSFSPFSSDTLRKGVDSLPTVTIVPLDSSTTGLFWVYVDTKEFFRGSNRAVEVYIRASSE